MKLDPELLLLSSYGVEYIRNFLSSRNYRELHSPVLSPKLIPEQHIAVYELSTEIGTSYLTPSPEVNLKYILSQFPQQLLDTIAGVYELTHSFRKMEQNDSLHQREFLMLEWYMLGQTWRDAQALMWLLVQELIEELLQSKASAALLGSWRRERLSSCTRDPIVLSVSEAVRTLTPYSLEDLLAADSVDTMRRSVGLPALSSSATPSGSEKEDLFQYLLVQHLEPALPKDRAVFLYFYPRIIPTLAKVEDGTPWCRRWELYVSGIEIANCYEEENNTDRIRDFVAGQMQKLHSRPSDTVPDYLCRQQLPDCSGIAFGVDRLLMGLLGYGSLEEGSAMCSELLCNT